MSWVIDRLKERRTQDALVFFVSFAVSHFAMRNDLDTSLAAAVAIAKAFAVATKD